MTPDRSSAAPAAPAVPARRGSTVRQRLVVLTLGILIPFLALFALRARERAVTDRLAAEARAMDLAYLVAAAVDEHVSHVQTLLAATTFAVDPRPEARARNDSVLLAIQESLRDTVVSTLWVMDTSGASIGTSMRPVPDPTTVSVADRRYFQDALRTRRPAIGEPVLGRPGGLWSITFAQPVLDDQRKVSAVVLGTIRLTSLSRILGKAKLPTGSIVTLIDDKGVVLGRTGATEETVGTDLSGHEPVRRSMAAGVGIDTSTISFGVPRVRAFTRTTGPRWQVFVVIPRSVAFASANAALRRDLLLATLTVIMALLVAMALARGLTRPLDELTASALSVAGGDYRQRPLHTTARELATLGESFNTMAETVAARNAELHASEQRYRLLFETSPLPMIVFALDTLQILAANAASRKQYGYSDEEFLALRITDLRPPEERLRLHQTLHALNQMQTDGSPVNTGIWRHRKKDASVFEVEVFTVKVEFEGQRARQSTVMDVTARRQAERALADSEERLRRSNEMESLGRFAGGIAHDFNNLLTGILGYCDLALDDIAPDSPGRSDVAAIRVTADRAATLTRQILAFSRKQVLQPVPLDVNEVIGAMDGILQRLLGEQHALELVLAPRTGAVLADRAQLEQVVLNLVVNARDAMPDGGTVRMATGELLVRPSDAHPPFDLSPGGWICLSVHDTGVGMTPAVQAQIFEPFFTTKERGKGTGLGLPMVDGIVRQSGGTLHVESAPRSGSTFRVFLPRSGADASLGVHTSPVLSAVTSDGSTGEGYTVLLAEDEGAVRAVVESVLRRHGYQVLSARDGTEALQVAANHKGTIHLLLTDVIMPGMGGPELAEQLRRSQPALPVLFASGYTDDDSVLRGVATDEMAFLAKPFTPQQLVSRVRALLAEDAGDVADAADPDSELTGNATLG